MIKSASRWIKCPLLSESMLTNGAAIRARLNVITSKSICTTSLCNKEIRSEFSKTRVGSSKYGILEGEATPDLLNATQK